MAEKDLKQRLTEAGKVGSVEHADFEGYVTVIERRKKTDKGWVSEGTPYMSVDGRLAMANRDHLAQGKRMMFENPVVLVDNAEQLTLMVVIESEIYGRRHGIATSRKVDGSPIEMQHPWEIGETSATGRALAAMGYGLIPGSGIASAEDMLKSQARDGEMPADERAGAAAGAKGTQRRTAPAARGQAEAAADKKKPAAGDAKPLTDRQQSYLVNHYAREFGLSPEASTAALNAFCNDFHGRPLAQLTGAEGRALNEAITNMDEGLDPDLWLAKQAGEAQAAAAAAGYLSTVPTFNAVVTVLTDEHLAEDPMAQARQWQQEGLDQEQVKDYLDKLRHTKWRARYFAGLKEQGITPEGAKALLEIDSISEMYGNTVESVLHSVKELAAKAKPPAKAGEAAAGK